MYILYVGHKEKQKTKSLESFAALNLIFLGAIQDLFVCCFFEQTAYLL